MKTNKKLEAKKEELGLVTYTFVRTLGDYKTSDISSDNLKIVLNACIKTIEDYFYYLNEEED